MRLRRLYLHRLARLYRHTVPAALTLADLILFMSNPGWGPEARRSARSSLRLFYRWAEAVALVDVDPTRFLPTVLVPRGIPRPTPERIVVLAFDRADTRGRLMILLALLAGMRRTEIATLHIRHVSGDAIHVTGKGGHQRIVPLHPMLAEALAGWAALGFVFPGKDHGHLSPHWVGKLLGTYLGPGWTGHTLRHAAATAWYATERDLRAVQELLGHSRPETTARYTRLPVGAALRSVLDATYPLG